MEIRKRFWVIGLLTVSLVSVGAVAGSAFSKRKPLDQRMADLERTVDLLEQEVETLKQEMRLVRGK